LAHPKTLAFFTHCGMHGVLEAIYHAVPIVGMPVFIDQVGQVCIGIWPTSVDLIVQADLRVRVEEKAIGVTLAKSATEEEIYQAIVQARDDDKYKLL